MEHSLTMPVDSVPARHMAETVVSANICHIWMGWEQSKAQDREAMSCRILDRGNVPVPVPAQDLFTLEQQI